MIVCGFSSVMCAIVLVIFIPESPKFTFAQGNEEKTLKILRYIYTLNTGKSADNYKVISIIKDKEYEDSKNNRKCGFFEFMWSQTVPLFKHPHLKNTSTACFLQFAICATCNGFATFFPEILNKVYLWTESQNHVSSTVCEILDNFNENSAINGTVSSLATTCITKIELGTFWNLAAVMIAHCIGWFIISVIINWTGKLAIIVSIMFIGGICAFLISIIEMPTLSIYLYTALLCIGMNMSVVNSSTVELYPTTLRFLFFF